MDEEGWKEIQWWFDFLNQKGIKGVSKDTWVMVRLHFIHPSDGIHRRSYASLKRLHAEIPFFRSSFMISFARLIPNSQTMTWKVSASLDCFTLFPSTHPSLKLLGHQQSTTL
jgi:hypothetical protein